MKASKIFTDLKKELDSGNYIPVEGEAHRLITEWLNKHKAKKAKRKAKNKNLQNKEALDAIKEASILIDKVLEEVRARRKEQQAKFKNGGICADSASQEGVLGKGESVIADKPKVGVLNLCNLNDAQFACVTVEEVQDAAKKFADQIADEAPLGCTPIATQNEQQPTKPRLFQACDKVTVKGRTGAHVLEANPDYPNESRYPLMTPLLHLSGNTELERFTDTGHWTVLTQANGFPPVLELVEEEEQSSPEPATKCNPNTWYLVNKNTPVTCLPENGDKLLVEDFKGGLHYAIYSGYLEFDIHKPEKQSTDHYRAKWFKHSTLFVRKFLILPSLKK